MDEWTNELISFNVKSYSTTCIYLLNRKHLSNSPPGLFQNEDLFEVNSCNKDLQ